MRNFSRCFSGASGSGCGNVRRRDSGQIWRWKIMLKVENLSIWFDDRGSMEQAVKGISFSMEKGEILGIVGESGSGKTMTALAIAGILKKNAVLESGRIEIEEKELLSMTGQQMRKLQGKEISMIFQEPMTALNPTMQIGKQVEEALLLHEKDAQGEKRESTGGVKRRRIGECGDSLQEISA